MKHRKRRARALLGAAALCLLASSALAQTYPQIKGPGGTYVPPTPVLVIGYDSVTGAACYVGATATCSPSASVPTTTDRSVAISAGGTAQTVMAANPARRAFYVWNPDPAEAAWCSFTTTAAANGLGSFAIGYTTNGSGAFGMEQNAPTGALSCVAATTGHKITAWESQ